MSELTVAQWLLVSAEQDLLAAEILSHTDGINDATVGFHVQHAIEKAIKVELGRCRIPFRRTHDVAELLDLAADSALGSPPNAEWIDEYTPYAVEARYGLIAPRNLNRQRALDDARAVVSWAKARASGDLDPQ